MKNKEITIEEAKKVIEDYPFEDNYVQAKFEQFLNWGEYDDNTVESSNYWNQCNKIVKKKSTQNI